jgi:hypothetical protein
LAVDLIDFKFVVFVEGDNGNDVEEAAAQQEETLPQVNHVLPQEDLVADQGEHVEAHVTGKG